MTIVSEWLDAIDENFEDTPQALKIAALQGAIDAIAGSEPWPFLETSMNLNFDGSSPIPTNFPDDFRASLRVRDLVTKARIKPRRLDDADDEIAGNYTKPGNPRFYYFEGGRLNVWPIPPAATGRLKLRYLRHNPRITASSGDSEILIPVTAAEAVLFRALIPLYTGADDTELAQAYQVLADERITIARAAFWKQQYDEPESIRQSAYDDWDLLY